MRTSHKAVLVLILGMVASAAWTLDTQATPNSTFAYNGKVLALRSSAIKEVSFLKIDVYEVGLYLESASTPPDSFLASVQVKALRLRFLADVKGKKLAEAWMKDLRLYCESGCDSLVAQGQPIAEKLPDIPTGQIVSYVVLPDRVDVVVGQVLIGQLEGPEASHTILAAFLGPKAPTALRAELLQPQVEFRR